MRYLITDTTIVEVAESAGTIQNVGRDKVEISDSREFRDSIVLYPLNKYTFDTQIYIRSYDNYYSPIEVNVVTFAVDSGGGSVTVDEEDVATDDEAGELFDDIFGSDTALISEEDVATDDEANELFDDIFGADTALVNEEDVATDDEANELFDDIFGGN